MGFVRRTPKNVNELESSLQKLYENKGHINSVKANESTNHLEVDLDWSANHMGGEEGKDFYLQIKRGKLNQAKDVADRLLRGHAAPTRGEAQVLFDFIDPQAQ